MVDIVYYKSERNAELEAKLGGFGGLGVCVGEDKRAFLMALSEAVGRSDVIIAVGAVSALSATLAKALSMPLAPVNWSAIGLSGDPEATLPQGALPLIVDGSVYGMIIESGSQCIIAIDDEPAAAAHLTDTYILTYLEAICAQKPTEQVQPEEESVPEGIRETVTVPQTVPEAEHEDDFPHIQPVEHFEEEGLEQKESEPNIFADIEDDDFLIIDDRKRGKGKIIALICVIVLLIGIAVGGHFGYTMWWLPKQYDSAMEAAKSKYDSGTLDIGTIPAEYALRFGALYEANKDIVGWISADGISLDMPIVTEAAQGLGYYSSHLFDGSANKYGTAHIKYAYDTTSNVNPNLVVYGNNFGDARAFSDVERLLSGSVAQNVTLTTDSVFYGEDSWRIFSVMVLKADGSEYNFADNFMTLSIEERSQRLCEALALSRVELGYDESDFAEIGFNDTFLTLVTPSSTDDGKVVVAMAVRIKTGNENSAPVVEAEPTEDDYSSETSSEEISSEAASSDEN